MKIIDGLSAFRQEYAGQIWLEVLIIPGYNNSEKELTSLKEAFEKISPDRIQLNTLDRPGSVDDLRPATREELKQIMNFWNLDNVEIIASAPERREIKAYREDTETAILETIARRPCTNEDLSKILGLHLNEVNKYLDVLDSENRVTSVRQERGVFYRSPQSKD